jgi:hypothetical protein
MGYSVKCELTMNVHTDRPSTTLADSAPSRSVQQQGKCVWLVTTGKCETALTCGVVALGGTRANLV